MKKNQTGRRAGFGTIGLVLVLIAAPVFIAVGFWFELTVYHVCYFASGEAAVYLLAVIFLLLGSGKKTGALPERSVGFTNSDTSVNDALLNLPAPIVLLNLENGQLVWVNRSFSELLHLPSAYFGLPVHSVLPGFELKWVLEGKQKMPEYSYIGGRCFEVYAGLIRHTGEAERGLFASLYWVERTEEQRLKSELLGRRLVVGELVCDNYDEVSRGASESKRGTMMAELDTAIAAWVEKLGAECIFRLTDRDRYIFFTSEEDYRKMAENRFEILDKVREILDPNGTPVTISVGIGREAGKLGEAERFATLALDMAISRGGDQAVVRERNGFLFFGGRTREKEKSSRVRSRIMADALKGLINDSNEVFAMGHRVADLDSLGGAVGIVAAARKCGKRARIIIDKEMNNASVMMDMLELVPEYKDVFITPEEALLEVEPGALLVVVDTNRRNYVESVDLLASFSKIAVVDHHRRVADYIDNAALNIHEPTASSVCELLVEVLSYILESGDMLRAEASAMLAGIILDTKSFAVKTGVRTFEAAAYLRRNGADSVEIKRMFQSDLESYIERAEIVKQAVFFESIYALSVFRQPVNRAIAAQAADDLMNIVGVAGSFVIFPFDGAVNVSARSLGRINVQLIMEKMGGGGHYTTAGVQLKGKTLDEVTGMLKDAITLYQFEQR